MLISKECDYAVRMARALDGRERTQVRDICGAEDIPLPFAYKILKKLEKAGIVKSYRGSNGGYELTADLNSLTLYDVFSVVDKELFIMECLGHSRVCSVNKKEAPCMVHSELLRVQHVLEEELKRKSLREVLAGPQY